jgi:hypothetical protein
VAVINARILIILKIHEAVRIYFGGDMQKHDIMLGNQRSLSGSVSGSLVHNVDQRLPTEISVQVFAEYVCQTFQIVSC